MTIKDYKDNNRKKNLEKIKKKKKEKLFLIEFIFLLNN